MLSRRLSSLMYLSFSGHMSGHVPTTTRAEVSDVCLTMSAGTRERGESVNGERGEGESVTGEKGGREG